MRDQVVGVSDSQSIADQQPLDLEQKRLVTDRTQYYIDTVATLLQCRLDPIAVEFNLNGRTAGMYQVRNGRRAIRFNPYLFAKYFDENLSITVPHEVAHYAVDVVHGRRVRPHGPEWRHLMQLLGVDASVRCEFDMAGIPQRRQRRHRYDCLCNRYLLSTTRHNAIQRRRQKYLCRHCQSELKLINNDTERLQQR